MVFLTVYFYRFFFRSKILYILTYLFSLGSFLYYFVRIKSLSIWGKKRKRAEIKPKESGRKEKIKINVEIHAIKTYI